ncbi:MAG: AAA family ATPase [Acidimicrobiales bacterium]|nr:AAA family ATPase [Acidimicrobiales bacterium]
MRVDNQPSGQPAVLDPRAKLKLYRSAFRRRWFLVLIPAVLGAAGGWFTWSAPPKPVVVNERKSTPVVTGTYFKAVHVLTLNPGSGSGDVPTISLPQAAYLANTGSVPQEVAKELQVTEQEVQSSVIGIPHNEVSSVDVIAVGEDPDKAVRLANATANALTLKITNEATAKLAQARDKIMVRLADLDQQIADLDAQLATNPPNRSQVEAQRLSITNEYASVYQQFTSLSSVDPTAGGLSTLEVATAVSITKPEYTELRRQIREGASYITGVSPTQPAEAATEPTTPEAGMGRSTRAGMGGILGLGLGVALTLMLERFDGKLRRRGDVEEVTGYPVIAEIPEFHRNEIHGTDIAVLTKPMSQTSEAYRVVRSAVMFAMNNDDRPRNGALTVLVTSPAPAEGKTTTVSNLAAVLAEGGLKVLVVNCDFRRPRVQAYLLENGDSSNESAVTVDAGRAGSVQLAPTRIPGVRLVSGLGERDASVQPLEVITMQRKVMDLAKPLVDVILLDTAPLLATNDASALIDIADQVLLVVRSNKTSVDSAELSAELLNRFDAPVIGVVFNALKEVSGAYYHYGYQEVQSERDKNTSKAVPVEAQM